MKDEIIFNDEIKRISIKAKSYVCYKLGEAFDRCHACTFESLI